MLTIKEICARTGLHEWFVRRCVKRLSYLLNPENTRGDNNEILLDSNSYVIFDRIKHLKEQGLKLPSIQATLDREFSKTPPSLAPEVPVEGSSVPPLPPDTHLRYYLEKFSELQEARITEYEKFADTLKQKNQELLTKEQELRDLQEKTRVLEGEQKMLTSGKSVFDILQENAARAYRLREQQRLLKELQTLPWYQVRKRQRLLAELETLLQHDEEE